ncbi:hypothetical protein LXA43DRAFT_329457 [Ganoderma leucocontextum]|nr:hypothetical protein LXA43DRAFT_329340 [Ganoderma leucocontextum]KAI1792621.1 hypothetical protein LXA43DRAFT_329457 [Ganoderma leucocontextum]
MAQTNVIIPEGPPYTVEQTRIYPASRKSLYTTVDVRILLASSLVGRRLSRRPSIVPLGSSLLVVDWNACTDGGGATVFAWHSHARTAPRAYSATERHGTHAGRVDSTPTSECRVAVDGSTSRTAPVTVTGKPKAEARRLGRNQTSRRGEHCRRDGLGWLLSMQARGEPIPETRHAKLNRTRVRPSSPSRARPHPVREAAVSLPVTATEGTRRAWRQGLVPTSISFL